MAAALMKRLFFSVTERALTKITYRNPAGFSFFLQESSRNYKILQDFSLVLHCCPAGSLKSCRIF